MPKSIGYFVSAPFHGLLAGNFGDRLENLSYSEKCHLLGVLAGQQQQVADGETDYNSLDAYGDHSFLDSNGKVISACELLQSADSSQIKSLILALSQYIYESR